MRILSGIAIVLVGVLYTLALLSIEPSHRLVGQGCAGAGGPLYADEEDHFPPCKSITRQ